ncbi:hypothetical protein [Streptomyces sp. NPDC058240]|uniref:hypothetical protein n=1 Tax=Streptomyces sp. NPDC058240 TaxID=3346396 RepID=UPI0036DFDAB0
MQYYGAYNRSALYPLLKRINAYVVRWLRGKYRRLRRSWSATFRAWWSGVDRHPRLLAHWVWGDRARPGLVTRTTRAV